MPAEGGAVPAPYRLAQWLWGEESAQPLRAFERALALATLLHYGALFLHAGEWLTRSGFRLSNLSRSPAMPPSLGELPGVLVPLVAFAFAAALLSVLMRPAQRWARWVLAVVILYSLHVAPLVASAADSLLLIGWLVLATSVAQVDGQCSAAPRRILQVSLVLYYLGAGLGKALHGGWLGDWQALGAVVQGTEHTAVAAWMLRTLPLACWAILQAALLLWELGSPLWLGFARLRVGALKALLSYHVLGALMFTGSWPIGVCGLAFAVLWLRESDLPEWLRN